MLALSRRSSYQYQHDPKGDEHEAGKQNSTRIPCSSLRSVMSIVICHSSWVIHEGQAFGVLDSGLGALGPVMPLVPRPANRH